MIINNYGKLIKSVRGEPVEPTMSELKFLYFSLFPKALRLAQGELRT